MQQQVGIRVRMIAPPPGVRIQVQRGRDELLGPIAANDGELVFEFAIDVDLTSGQPNFLGKYAHGPKGQRFLYVNSGTYAGDAFSCWGRRAKLSLMGIGREQVELAISDQNATLETSFPGTGRDGGPTCASVKGLVWKVVKR